LGKLLPIVRVSGLMLVLFSLTYTLPILTALAYQDGTVVFFIEALLLTSGSGGALWLATRRFERELRTRDGFLLAVLGWTGMAALATFPLIASVDGLSFTDAYFETMSGLSTTGATVLAGLDDLPPAVNLWRHELNWMGGMGILVLAVAILPLLGVGGRQLFIAETPGPMKDTKLTPRMAETARNLWAIYVSLTLLCIASLKVAGMGWFDAVCHAFATMSLGGFSTHDASIGYFDSPVIEAVLIAFMLIAALNFATHFLGWRAKGLAPYRRDAEAVAVLTLVSASSIGIALFLWLAGAYGDPLTAFRHASFNLVSIATDCGFVSVDFSRWPIFAPLWMLFLSCITASAGSTGGGIKMMRTLILGKQSRREMFLLIHPSAVVPLKVGGQVIPDRVVSSVLGFISLYFATVVILTLVLVASGLDFISAFSAIVACINNAGPGLGRVGPATNYAGLSDFQTWICTAAMLVGRLEILTVVILFTPAFWRK
jgi:trk system potassium uptake protein TrkH